MIAYRKFWREVLPKIKYRNPSVPIQVSRHMDADGPSVLHIYTADPASSAQPHTQAPTHSLNMRDLGESEILDALVAQTGAEQIKPTVQELQEMEELREFKERSEKDRLEVREKLLKERREALMLKLARGGTITGS